MRANSGVLQRRVADLIAAGEPPSIALYRATTGAQDAGFNEGAHPRSPDGKFGSGGGGGSKSAGSRKATHKDLKAAETALNAVHREKDAGSAKTPEAKADLKAREKSAKHVISMYSAGYEADEDHLDRVHKAPKADRGD
jgi:hypothetical protein